MSRFFSEKYDRLIPYTPGEQPLGKRYVKLNTNESPFPPSPRAQQLAREAAETLQLYSDPECRALRERMAHTLGHATEELIFTNGSDEALNFAFMAFCDTKTPAIFPDITYGFYKVFAQLGKLPYEEIPLKADFTIDIEDYCRREGTVSRRVSPLGGVMMTGPEACSTRMGVLPALVHSWGRRAAISGRVNSQALPDWVIRSPKYSRSMPKAIRLPSRSRWSHRENLPFQRISIHTPVNSAGTSAG